MHRLLTVSIASFSPQAPDAFDLIEDSPPPPLPFADVQSPRLSSAMATIGYEVTIAGVSADGSHYGSVEVGSARDLGRFVSQTMESDPDGVLVVHVLSHGHLSDTDNLYVVGPDGKTAPDTAVDRWLTQIEDFRDTHPRTLFILDLCRGGAAARRPWQLGSAEGDPRSWVLAACAPRQLAFNGRLTAAVANVVLRLANGELGLAPSVEYAPLRKMFAEISREVARLCDNDAALVQNVVANLADLSRDPHAPFFPNPAYRSGTTAESIAGLDPTLSAFVSELDPALDPGHFISRASGVQGESTHPMGLFHGRREALVTLSEWIDSPWQGPSVRMVTGSPGCGKSALLGVLVCAAHPTIRHATRPIWMGAAMAPSTQPHMAAVHARQRGLDEIVASIARQLDFTLLAGQSTWTAAELIGTITSLIEPPLIMIDALDEALAPRSVVTVLLLRLARARRPDGSIACHLLVGARPWPEFDVLAAEGGPDSTVDLDAVDPAVLQRDIRDYLEDALRSHPPYDALANKEARAVITHRVAEALMTEGGAPPGWGAFLVAGLLVNFLSHRPAVTPAQAEQLVASVPRTLPAVFELDIQQRTDSALLHEVLTALAHARGDGMPLRVLLAASGAFLADSREATIETVTAALDAGRFYLRTSVDEDGTSLYRLYHQGLSDYLAASASAPSRAAMFDALVASTPRDSDGRTLWSLADPYILRHLADHAAEVDRADEVLSDPGFLLYADPLWIARDLEHARTARSRLATAVYRTSFVVHSVLDIAGRAQVLASDAARHGSLSLATEFRDVTAESPGGHMLWATGSDVHPRRRATLGDSGSQVTAVHGAFSEGRLLIIGGSWDGSVRMWDSLTTQQLGRALVGDGSKISALVSCTSTSRPIVVAGSWRGQLHFWDIASGEPMCDPVSAHEGPIVDMCAFTDENGHDLVVTASMDGRCAVWDVDTRDLVAVESTGHPPRWQMSAVAVSTRTTGVQAHSAGHDRQIRTWDPYTGALRGPVLQTQSVPTGLRPIVNGDELLLLCETGLGTQLWDPSTAQRRPLPRMWFRQIDVTSQHGRTALIGTRKTATGSRGAIIEARTMPSGEPIASASGEDFTSMASFRWHNSLLAATGHGDGSVRVWDLSPGEDLETMLRPGHPAKILQIRTLEEPRDGGVVVSLDAEGGVQARGASDGRSLGTLVASGGKKRALSMAVLLVAGEPAIVLATRETRTQQPQQDIPTDFVGALASTRHSRVQQPDEDLDDAHTQLEVQMLHTGDHPWTSRRLGGPPIADLDALATGSAIRCVLLDRQGWSVWDGGPAPDRGPGTSAKATCVRVVAHRGRSLAILGAASGDVSVWDIDDAHRPRCLAVQKMIGVALKRVDAVTIENDLWVVSADKKGQIVAGRPLAGEVRLLHRASGAVIGLSIREGDAGGPHVMVVTDSGKAELVNASSGRILAAQELPGGIGGADSLHAKAGFVAAVGRDLIAVDWEGNAGGY